MAGLNELGIALKMIVLARKGPMLTSSTGVEGLGLGCIIRDATSNKAPGHAHRSSRSLG